MIKISIHEPMAMSAVSFYRSIGTFSYLRKLNNNIRIDIPSSISWNSLIDTDILYMERPANDSDLKAMELAKRFNVKIWVDYDDLLLDIPEYNPAHEHYKQEHIIKNIKKALSEADIVTTSTEYLKEYYSKYNKNIHVIENSHNDYRFPFEKVDALYNSINWRGSPTHRRDIMSVAQYIFDISDRFPKWAWTFIGNDTWYITEHIKNCWSVKEIDIIAYFKLLKDLNSAIQISPLLFNEFNTAKSNIGWIEATYAGSVTIAPQLPEFLKPGCITYENKDGSFKYIIEKAIKSKEFRKKNYLESYEYIHDNLLLSNVNKKRLEIVETLYKS